MPKKKEVFTFKKCQYARGVFECFIDKKVKKHSQIFLDKNNFSLELWIEQNRKKDKKYNEVYALVENTLYYLCSVYMVNEHFEERLKGISVIDFLKTTYFDKEKERQEAINLNTLQEIAE